MKALPEITAMPRVRRDIARCREFLRHRKNARPLQRIREVFQAIRLLRKFPEMNPVRRIDPETGLSFRRHNAGQFAVVYVYFRPSVELPNGLVYLRAIFHASEEHGHLRVRDCDAEIAEAAWSPLSTRDGPQLPLQLATQGAR